MVEKLDLVDKKILTELDINCRITDTQLAKKVRKSREAVRYRIQRLQEKGIITGFITSVNPNKFGNYMFKVYLKIENIPNERKKFFKSLQEDRNVYWMGISDGAFDVVFAYLSNSITQYYEQIKELLEKWDHIIVQSILGTMVDTRQYTKRFFLNEGENEPVKFGGEIYKRELDDLDKKILNILINNARISLVELSSKVNSTIDIIRSRIKKMEKENIILQYRISIDLKKLGLEFYKSILYLKKLTKKDQEKLFNWMESQPSSQYYIRSIAPWDAELEFVVSNYHQFNEIINNLRKEFHEIIRNQEHLIMSYETWMPAYKEMLKPKTNSSNR